jgi:hypothetical protein
MKLSGAMRNLGGTAEITVFVLKWIKTFLFGFLPGINAAVSLNIKRDGIE